MCLFVNGRATHHPEVFRAFFLQLVFRYSENIQYMAGLAIILITMLTFEITHITLVILGSLVLYPSPCAKYSK